MAEKRGSVLDPLSWSDPIVRVYEACVDELLINLAKHFNVSAMGNIESFRYEVEMLAKMGAIRQETARIIARHIAQNEPMIEEALKTAMLDALETVEPELKHAAAEGLLNGTDMEVSDFVKSKLTSYSRQAKNQLNLVNTVMLEGTAEAYRKGVYAAVDIVRQLDAAQETLNVETGKVITGTSTLQQATRAAVKAMSQNGITGFVDRGGHRWSAEAYVRMDLKTTCSNAANRAVMDRNESYGNDLIWVRTNATARPGCYPWQGKVISMKDRARDVTDGNGNRVHAYAASQTTYGQPDGIFGINCHHGPMNVFIPGLSYIRGAGTAPEQAENDRLYELTQQQRKLEREVRYAKRDAAMYDAAGDREAFEKAALKVKEKTARLKAFVREHDSLVFRSDRTQVLGYNRSVSGKATATYNANLHLRYKGYLGTNDPLATARKYKEIVETGDERLFNGFMRAVDKGDVNVLVGIDEYIHVARHVEQELIGLTSVDGTIIKSYATHFVDRVIGQTAERKDGMRTGVPVLKIKETLLNGSVCKMTTSKYGDRSIKIIGNENEVALNPDTGMLIQANPRR